MQHDAELRETLNSVPQPFGDENVLFTAICFKMLCESTDSRQHTLITAVRKYDEKCFRLSFKTLLKLLPCFQDSKTLNSIADKALM